MGASGTLPWCNVCYNKSVEEKDLKIQGDLVSGEKEISVSHPALPVSRQGAAKVGRDTTGPPVAS